MATKTKMKFQMKKAGGAKQIKQKSKRNNDFGNMVWIPKDGSRTLRIAAEPADWPEYQFVMVEETDSGKTLGFRGKLPCFDGFDTEVPEAARSNPRVSFVIPVVVIEDGKAEDTLKFYEPPKKILTDLIAHFERRQTLTDRDFEVAREGTGRDTVYTLFADDPKKRASVQKLGQDYLDNDDPSFADELVRMVKEFMTLYSDEVADDEEEVAPKSTPKRQVLQDNDEEEQTDDEEADDSEVSGNFVVTNVDVDAYTIDLTAKNGTVYETVYLDRNRDTIESIKEDATYKVTIFTDDDGDWIASTSPKEVKAKKAAKR